MIKLNVVLECFSLYIDTFTESDADRKWRGQNETQPYRGPGGLNFGWLVDQYMAIGQPILQKLDT